MSGSIDENVDVIRRGYERINRWEVERLFGVEEFFLDESAAVEAADRVERRSLRRSWIWTTGSRRSRLRLDWSLSFLPFAREFFRTVARERFRPDLTANGQEERHGRLRLAAERR
jgi:hypothetical protein